MKQIYPLVALAVLLAGGWFFVSNFKVDVGAANGAPQLQPRQPGANSPFAGVPSLPSIFGSANSANQPASSAAPPLGNLANAPYTAPPNNPVNVPVSAQGRQAPVGKDMIRIASFNIQVFGEAKLARPEIMQVLTRIVANFDIIAIQEIRAQSQNVLPDFIQMINSTGARYDYVIGERLGRTVSKEQYAYVFNTDTVEVDRRTLYTVADPDDLLHREPFVAWFRCRNVNPQQAFTFSLVNIHTDPDEAAQEVNVLDDVFRAVRDDGRGEDDVILLGDFNADDRHLGHLGRMPNVRWTISQMATNTRGTAQYDNMVFDQLATPEFLGRSGVFDFMREYNLSLTQAEQVSDHLPIWAEFSVYEGGVPGRVANSRSYQPSIGARTNAYAAQSQYDRGYANSSAALSDYDVSASYGANPNAGYNNPSYNANAPHDTPGANYVNGAGSVYSGRPDYSANAPTYTADPRYPTGRSGGYGAVSNRFNNRTRNAQSDPQRW